MDNTAVRWQRAAERARLANVAVVGEVEAGRWVYLVESATVGTGTYAVRRHPVTRVLSCECAAAERGDWCCMHRAAVLVLRKELPAPTPPAAAPCRYGCGGRGWHADPDGRSAPERCPCRDRLAA